MSDNEPKSLQCSLCPFYATYDRYDSKYLDDSTTTTTTTTTTTKKTKKESAFTVDLLEQVYLLRDPFVAIKENQSKIPSLIIGSVCSVCSQAVCVHGDCSLFYTRRFCLKCVAKYRDEFPREILDEIGTKKLDKFIQEEEEEENEQY